MRVAGTRSPKNSFIQFPLPARELEIQRQPIYTYGGGGAGSAPDANVGQVSHGSEPREMLIRIQ